MGAGSEEMESPRRCSDALKVKALLLWSFPWPIECYTTSRAGKLIPLLVNIATFVQYLQGKQIFIVCWSTQKGIWRSWIQLVTDEWEQVRLKGAELHNTVTWMRQLHPTSIRNRRKIEEEQREKITNKFPKIRWNFFCVKSSLTQGRVLPYEGEILNEKAHGNRKKSAPQVHNIQMSFT